MEVHVILCMYSNSATVDPPIVDSPNKGHNKNNLSIKDTS